jgi:hypothetical protein
MELTTDQALLRFQQRPLGQVSRVEVRRWLNGRRGVLQCGHVRLERGGRNVYTYLGLAPPDLMPHDMAEQLEAVVWVLTGEARVRAVVTLEMQMLTLMRRRRTDCVNTWLRHMSARRPGSTCLYCPQCDVDWVCEYTTSMISELLDVTDVEDYLERLTFGEAGESGK